MPLQKSFFSTLAAATLAVLCLPALAVTTSVTTGATSSEAGASTITFGTTPTTNNTGSVVGSATSGDTVATGTLAGVTYTYVDGALFNNSVLISGVAARPVGSDGNYYSVGNTGTQQGTGTLTFSQGLSYFGFLWGSPDAGNEVSVFSGATKLATFNGTAVKNPANGDQNYARFFNIFAGAGQSITKVTFAYNGKAFETDNHAFIAAVTPVPEPETYAMLLAGLGLMGVVARRKANRK
jgi:hypothetical protein